MTYFNYDNREDLADNEIFIKVSGNYRDRICAAIIKNSVEYNIYEYPSVRYIKYYTKNNKRPYIEWLDWYSNYWPIYIKAKLTNEALSILKIIYSSHITLGTALTTYIITNYIPEKYDGFIRNAADDNNQVSKYKLSGLNEVNADLIKNKKGKLRIHIERAPLTIYHKQIKK